MKKITAFLLLTGLCASLIPFSAFAAEDPANLAKGLPADSILCADTHEDNDWNWHLTNLNDGNPVNAGGTAGQNAAGGGYHSAYGTEMPEPQYVGYNFGSAKTFNTVIVYTVSAQTFPTDFEIQVSNDGEKWTTVHSEKDYTINSDKVSIPLTFTFEEQTAQYVRLYATKLNNDGTNYAMKLTEMEVYNIDAAKAPKKIKIDPAKVTGEGYHEDGPWNLTNLVDGDTMNVNNSVYDYGQFAGFHSKPGADTTSVTITLDEATEFNRFVIYPSNTAYSIKYETDGIGIFFPKNFTIEVSTDGEKWTTVVEKTGYEATGAEAQVFNIDSVKAQYVRFTMTNLAADGYAKLSEFEIYNTKIEVPPEENEGTGGEQPAKPDNPAPTKPEEKPNTPAEKPNNNNNNNNNNTNKPAQTGDATVFAVVLTVIALAGTAVITKKRTISK